MQAHCQACSRCVVVRPRAWQHPRVPPTHHQHAHDAGSLPGPAPSPHALPSLAGQGDSSLAALAPCPAPQPHLRTYPISNPHHARYLSPQGKVQTTDNLYFDWLSWAGVEARRVYLSTGGGRAYPVLQPAGSILVPGEREGGWGRGGGGCVPVYARRASQASRKPQEARGSTAAGVCSWRKRGMHTSA